ncbi:septum formation initiator family protein [Allostreptomyces psammosilenae]|uniref:Cell division protein FtsL n=1 Tax=Allostreptomyces psammosilenae TaxID=1892865 RepID=A0A853A2I7_9ACTN|nr:septum formation initiator family protein [Allostreptomyces psammosilenae]NYI07094.1 hypothetical protein [Allostreptomyces psammosilenae]
MSSARTRGVPAAQRRSPANDPRPPRPRPDSGAGRSASRSTAARPAPAGSARGRRGGQPARAPFVGVVVALLTAGLLALLTLNTALNQGSFELDELERENRRLAEERQALRGEVDERSAPSALAEEAERLGMVPGGGPLFLGPDGELLGDRSAAVASAQPEASPEASPETSASGGAASPESSGAPAQGGE